MTPTLDTILTPDLRKTFAGQVITPADTEYDAARTVFVGGFDQRPDVIFRPADAAAVARIVDVARDTGSALAVRSGGHSGNAHSVSNGGITLDLSAMRGLDVDVEARTARAQTGLTAGQYTAAVGEHGLATGFGDAGSVGIGGITTGGGVGYLSRRYGMTIDDVLAAEVVTADGQVFEVDDVHHPDLFWAVRGGGGNFGVVTRFTYRLHEVPAAVGGMLMLPATAEILSGFLAEASAAPDELSTIVNVMKAPPMPFVPAEYHGQPVILALVCYAGGAEDGEQALKPFRALATPIVDMARPITYPEMYPPDENDFHPTSAGRTGFADSIDRDVVDTIIERVAASTSAMAAVQIRPLGGAIDRVPAEATAYAHRGRRFMINVAAFYDGLEDLPVREAWVSEVMAVVRNGSPGAYVNFLADSSRIRDAYPGATWDRLVDVKRHYDPANLFHLNHNVPPA